MQSIDCDSLAYHRLEPCAVRIYEHLFIFFNPDKLKLRPNKNGILLFVRYQQNQ